jgi:hypothetical protein
MRRLQSGGKYGIVSTAVPPEHAPEASRGWQCFTVNQRILHSLCSLQCLQQQTQTSKADEAARMASSHSAWRCGTVSGYHVADALPVAMVAASSSQAW